MKKLLIILLLFIVNNTNAQDIKRTAIWYFGENAGIDFNTTPPTALTDGQVNTIEGCASICDTNGNLLFYTDGRTVWNKYHDTMPNGFGLMGNESSTQAALIVPKPETDSIYYIFTTSPDFAVNEVNIYANAGKGEVVIKNKLLVSSVGEKQTATKHANGIDYWVVTHGAYNDEYYAFLVTKYGIVECPVISKIGTDFSQYSWFMNQGGMKANMQGTKVATCTYDAYWIELFDFDNNTGLLSNTKYLSTTGFSTSVEFSLNDRYLYVIDRNKRLFQFDITSNNQTEINNSRKSIYVYNNGNAYVLQIGLDKKMYVVRANFQKTGVINRPDLNDTLCDYIPESFDLAEKNTLYGLPNFVTSFFNQPSVDFMYNLDCKVNTIDFIGYDTINATKFKWHFVKGSKRDSSTLKNPTYTFPDTGKYTITFIASNTNRADTVTKEIFIYPKYTLNLGNDTTICSTPFVLNAGKGQFCYTWQDSSSNSTFEVNQSGTYHVKVVSQNHCTQFDTIRVTIANPPTKPTITRNNDTLVSSTAQSYQWYKNNSSINGAIQQKLKITQNAYYQVEIGDSNTCKVLSDSFNFIYVGLDKIHQQRFVVYPNSAKDYLYITKPKEITSYTIQILDIQGKPLLAHQLSENTEEILLTNIAEGVYVLKISFADNKTETHKLIISK